jgi:cytochrome P450
MNSPGSATQPSGPPSEPAVSRCPFHRLTNQANHHPLWIGFGALFRGFAQMLPWHSDSTTKLPEGYSEIPQLTSPKRHLVWDLLHNPLDALARLRAHEQDIAQYCDPLGRVFIATRNPHIIRAILLSTDRGVATESDKADKSMALGKGTQVAIGPDNILADSNERWEYQRTLLNRHFGLSSFENTAKVALIQEVIGTEIDKLKSRINTSRQGSIEIELQQELSHIALRVALAVIFDKRDVPDKTIHELHDATRAILKGFMLEAVTPFAMPNGFLALFSRQAAEIVRGERILIKFAEGLLEEEKKRNPSSLPTALTSMVEALNTDTPLLDRRTVINNIRVMLVAGHETSGNVLAHTIANLALREDLTNIVLNEAASKEFGAAHTLSTLRKALPYTGQVIDESLRLHPPIYSLPRRITSDMTVECPAGKYLIPKGAEVLLDLFSAQRDPSYWGEGRTGYAADRFEPQRWSPANIEKHGLSNQDRDLFSFGLGPRVCLGAHMFWTEALPFIATFMKTFTVTPQFPNTEEGMGADLSLQREGGYKVLLSLRDSGEV